MKNYLISFYNQPSVVVEAPNATAALCLCIGKIATYEEISESLKMILINAYCLKFVKWPY